MSLASVLNARLQADLQREQMAANQSAARRSGRNQMLGAGLGTLGSLGGAYLGSPAGSAALSSALGLGGASAGAGAAGGVGSAVLSPITNAITGALGTGGTAATTGGLGSMLSGLGGALTPVAAPLAIGAGLYGLADAFDVFGGGGDVNARERRAIRGDELADFYTDDNRLQFDGIDVDVGSLGGLGSGGQMGSYNVDLEQAQDLTSDLAQTIGGLNPLMAIQLADRDPSRVSDFTGEFANAIMAGGDPESDVKAAYEQAGFDRDKAYTEVLNMTGIDDATRDAYLAAIDDVFGVKNPNQGM